MTVCCLLWSTVPGAIEFNNEEKSFAEGGFRQAFKAIIGTSGFKREWVIKKLITMIDNNHEVRAFNQKPQKKPFK